MRALSLGKVLIGINVGLVVLAVLGVAAGGLTHLERLANEQAIAQVRFAGAAANQALARSRDDARVSARILAERPTLARLLSSGDIAALPAFLERFRTTSRMTACAVWSDGRLVVVVPAGFAWGTPAAGPHDWGLEAGAPGTPLTLIASAPLTTVKGASVSVALRLDDAAATAIEREVGVRVAVLARATALANGTPDRQAQRAQAMEHAEPRAAGFAAEGSFVASVPLLSPAGDVVGIVEADLPMAGVTGSLRTLRRSLWAAALLVLVLAGVLGIVLARWLARPLQALTQASARIGQGDLTTPIPRAAGAEAAQLAASMEEMRRRLLHLTSELRRQQGEAEAVLGGIAEGVFAVDRDRRIRYLNPQAAALLGVRADQALGRFCGDALDPAPVDGERPCESHCPILDARFRGTSRATEHLRAGGMRRTVVVTSAPPPPASADVPQGPESERQFQILRDETAIEGARRARDAVLANISHEFRTPLAAQMASLELLRDRLSDAGSEGARPLVQSLERGALRLTQLIDNLLESVRIEAGELSIRRAAVALDEVAETAVEITAPLLAQREQRASLDLPFPLPEISGDAARLTQVLVNLLANSSKFAPLGSEIRVGGEVGAGTVTFWVDDEGPGLSPGSAERVFERFAREPGDGGDGEPAASGVGLGLWIVRSIVERHGGRVDATTAPGVGMRVRVVLPCHDVAVDATRRGTE